MSAPIDAELDRLYGAPFDDFVALRNELAARLKKSGDVAAASRIKALSKPSLPAWAVNQLHRERPAEIDALLAAGAAMRQGQREALAGGSPAEMRDATRAQRDAVSRLRREAAALLTRGGQAATDATLDKVQATLQALSMAGWQDAAPGRLTRDLSPPGLDALSGLLEASAGADAERARSPAQRGGSGVEVEVTYEGDPEIGTPETAETERREARARREEALAALEQARKRVRALRKETGEADEASDRARRRADAARREAEEAAARSEDLSRRAHEAATQATELRATVRSAEASVTEAEAALSAAEAEVRRLG